MKNLVKVLANKNTGEVFNETLVENKQTGETETFYNVMVSQKSLSNLSGLGRVSHRTAFLKLPAEALELIGDLKDGDVFPQQGKIVVKETLEPYKWTDKDGNKRVQEPKINPSTQEVITFEGQPVYRNQYFTTDLSEQDVFLKKTSTE